jgi:hypothetical protein
MEMDGVNDAQTVLLQCQWNMNLSEPRGGLNTVIDKMKLHKYEVKGDVY